ncbi:hypothetical protein [Sphingobium nicotianae]|uniref:STAS/SEC14 domain-containing protein n=1 Tax=Sphingobium nicotianae TaxID=2782607 RepID=A0A9X1D839_9SPHN|nr:hypothetical protein [Sphingobium nicotianae]MBT2185882.1 hypothetical protein [Sphingobium nicotianae]
MFELSYDPDRILMSIVQQGYWSMAEFREFEAQFSKLHNDIRKQHRNYRVIADCRDFAVQSPEIGQAFGVMFEKLVAENKGHYAILLQTTLNKLQAKRAIPQAHVHTFTDREEAMTWLFEDDSLPD